MQIADQVFGIDTAANALLELGDGEPAYLTRRFDRRDRAPPPSDVGARGDDNRSRGRTDREKDLGFSGPWGTPPRAAFDKGARGLMAPGFAGPGGGPAHERRTEQWPRSMGLHWW